MPHLVTEEPWGTIDLDLTTGQIFVQERWFYEWMLWPGVTARWTHPEKVATHSRIDKQVWGVWSGRAALVVRGRGDVAQRLSGKRLRLSLDVRWDPKPPGHWRVHVWKMLPGTGPVALHRSFVDPAGRHIELNTADLGPRRARNAAEVRTTTFLTVPHEFGHTIGAPSNMLPDEYAHGHHDLADSRSIMNVGRTIRARHLDAIVEALNRVTSGCAFAPEPGLR